MAPKPIEVIDLSSDDDEPVRLLDSGSFKGIEAYLAPKQKSNKKKKKRRRNKRRWEQLFVSVEASGSIGEKDNQEDDTRAVEAKKDVVPTNGTSPYIYIGGLKQEGPPRSSKVAEMHQLAVREATVLNKLERETVNAAEKGGQSHIVIDVEMLEESKSQSKAPQEPNVGTVEPEKHADGKKHIETVTSVECISKAIKETVSAAEEEGQLHMDKDVEMTKVSKTQSIQPQEPLVGDVEPEKHADRNKDVEIVTPMEYSSEALNETVNAAEEGEQSHAIKYDTVEPRKHAERNKEVGVTPVEVKSLDPQRNVVLRKLLQGPRYFDVPKSFWDKRDHGEVDCMEKQQKRPCFICGSFEHIGKHCVQGLDSFFCQRRGHLAKDCPERNECLTSSRICLRCGELGHDMASCMSNYSSDDLQKIQCYVCNSFGHLCCVNFPETGPEQVTCYNCGQPGHVGMVCQMMRRDNGQKRIFKCYLCGKYGHFSVNCPNTAMAQRRAAASSRAYNQRIDKNKGVVLGSQSAPQKSMEFHTAAPVEYNQGLGRLQMDARAWDRK